MIVATSGFDHLLFAIRLVQNEKQGLGVCFKLDHLHHLLCSVADIHMKRLHGSCISCGILILRPETYVSNEDDIFLGHRH